MTDRWWTDPDDPLYQAVVASGMPTRHALGGQPAGPPAEPAPWSERLDELARWMGLAIPGRGGVAPPPYWKDRRSVEEFWPFVQQGKDTFQKMIEVVKQVKLSPKDLRYQAISTGAHHEPSWFNRTGERPPRVPLGQAITSEGKPFTVWQPTQQEQTAQEFKDLLAPGYARRKYLDELGEVTLRNFVEPDRARGRVHVFREEGKLSDALLFFLERLGRAGGWPQ